MCLTAQDSLRLLQAEVVFFGVESAIGLRD